MTNPGDVTLPPPRSFSSRVIQRSSSTALAAERVFPLNPQPGDLILVRRRLRPVDWLTDPLSCFVSWRIQRASGSRWNHVACSLGRGEIAEAEWNRGVRIGALAEYSRSPAYEVKVIPLPPDGDGWAAVRFWREEAAHPEATYDKKSIVLLRFASALYGPSYIDKVVRGTPGDHAWICSELGAEGWQRAGITWARERIVSPGSLDRVDTEIPD